MDLYLDRESRDGLGAADHDQPYSYGHRPRLNSPFPFTTMQYGHLLALRGRIEDGYFRYDNETVLRDSDMNLGTPIDYFLTGECA